MKKRDIGKEVLDGLAEIKAGKALRTHQRDEPVILETTRRIPYEDHYYVIIPDIAAGARGRYTVYRLGSSSGIGRSGRAKVIGRELTLGHARRVARREAALDRLGRKSRR